METLSTIQQAIQVLGCTVGKLYELIKLGELEFKKENGVSYIHTHSIEKYLIKNRKIDSDYITIKEASILLNISMDMVRYWIDKGFFKTEKKGRIVYLREVDVLKFKNKPKEIHAIDAAKILGVSRLMFNKLLDSGTIKYVKNANYKMVLEADVLAYKETLESKLEIFSEYITISDAARTLEIGRNSLYTLMRNNEIPYHIINGKNRLKTVDVINYKNKSKEVHIRHCANILGISLKKLHQMIKEGVFSYRLVNRYKFLQLEDVLNYQMQLSENKAPLITVKKTAELLQCSPEKIYSMLNKNRLSYKRIGIYKLIPKEEVLNLIMKNKF